MYTYRCKVKKVVDGDTVDVDIDLGFNTWLLDQRIRLMGIDAPESRTSDPVEKVFGNLAKERVQQLCSDDDIFLISMEFEGKYGRILGDFGWYSSPFTMTEILLKERLAAPYEGQSKDEIETIHLANRAFLIESGQVELD